MTKNEDIASESDYEDDSNTSANHARAGSADKVAEFSSDGETPVLAVVSLPHRDTGTTSPHHIQSTSASNNQRPGADKTYDAVIPADASETEDPPWKRSDSSATNINSSSSITQQVPKAQGRRLTFADETGGALAEVNYSNRTHYSKQTGPSALGGTGRACCTIS